MDSERSADGTTLLPRAGSPSIKQVKKLTIVAATGGVGRQPLEQAVATGHVVTAVARNQGKLTRQVRTVAADLATVNPAVLQDAVAGADAILSALAPPGAGMQPYAGSRWPRGGRTDATK